MARLQKIDLIVSWCNLYNKYNIIVSTKYGFLSLIIRVSGAQALPQFEVRELSQCQAPYVLFQGLLKVRK